MCLRDCLKLNVFVLNIDADLCIHLIVHTKDSCGLPWGMTLQPFANMPSLRVDTSAAANGDVSTAPKESTDKPHTLPSETIGLYYLYYFVSMLFAHVQRTCKIANSQMRKVCCVYQSVCDV